MIDTILRTITTLLLAALCGIGLHIAEEIRQYRPTVVEIHHHHYPALSILEISTERIDSVTMEE